MTDFRGNAAKTVTVYSFDALEGSGRVQLVKQRPEEISAKDA